MAMNDKQTRGERLNNPGNIERSPRNKWKGQAPDQPDPRFVNFTHPVYGFRALAKTLLTYSTLWPQDDDRDIDTVREIICRWAPPKKDGKVENDTESYIVDVAKRCGLAPDERINMALESTLRKLVVAITIHENGRCAYPDGVIDDAVRRALA